MMSITVDWMLTSFVCVFMLLTRQITFFFFCGSGYQFRAWSLEEHQDNNIPQTEKLVVGFSLYVIKVQSKASYWRNKRMGTDADFLSLSMPRLAVKWEQSVKENVMLQIWFTRLPQWWLGGAWMREGITHSVLKTILENIQKQALCFYMA